MKKRSEINQSNLYGNLPVVRRKRFDKIKENGCGGVYNLRLGRTIIIKSPGYPKAYELNQKCTYLIKVSNIVI